MTRFWIRVNARLADDADVRAFARELYPKLSARLQVTATCGLLVSLWGRVIDEQEDGDVSGRDDDALEEWARWDGKRGVFATAFRARFTEDGLIREWADYQGTLITRRVKDRARKVAKHSTGIPAETPEDTSRTSSGIPAEVPRSSSRNDNGNDNGNEHSSFTPDERLVLDRIEGDARLAWESEISVAKQGMHGTPLTPEQIDRACRDYVGKGHMTSPSLRHFRGFLGSAGKAPTQVTAQHAGDDAGKAFAQIRALVQTRANPGRAAIRFIPKAELEKLGARAVAAYEQIGGADRFLDQDEKIGFVLRDFTNAYRAAEAAA